MRRTLLRLAILVVPMVVTLMTLAGCEDDHRRRDDDRGRHEERRDRDGDRR